jgi:hypothetical protein
MVLRVIRLKLVVPAVWAGLALGLHGCGSDKKSDDGSSGTDTNVAIGGDVGTGAVITGSAGAVTLDFSKATAGDQYVVMPIVLDDPTKVFGGVDGVNVQFKVSISSPGAVAVQSASFAAMGVAFAGQPELDPEVARSRADAAAAARMAPQEYDHGLRTLLNRFEPWRGHAQLDGFWQLARRLDLYGRETTGPMGLQAEIAADGTNGIEAYFRRGAESKGRQHPRFALAGSGACPADGDDISVPSKADPTQPTDVKVPSGGSVDGGNFCIVYLTEPVTPGSRAAVQATITEVQRRYRSIFYKDQTFAPVNGFTFKPVYVIADFSDTTVWPSGYQSEGAFTTGMSDDMNLPMIYMPSDYQKLTIHAGDANYNADYEKTKWHGTIAHETQHSIMNYFRVRTVNNGKGTQETSSIDEGIAHFTEDMFGHGRENFNGFPFLFLQSWWKVDPDVNLSVLWATDSSSPSRGAAQTFMYYLVSQAGGITFDSNGVFEAGPGLTLLESIVTKANGVIGPANVAAQVGGDWATTIGNYFGALAADNAVTGANKLYTVADPQKITDLLGTTGKNFGMHYNNFTVTTVESNSALTAPSFTTVLADGMTTVTQQEYATRPLTYTVADPTQVVTLTGQNIPNTVVSVVRVK